MKPLLATAVLLALAALGAAIGASTAPDRDDAARARQAAYERSFAAAQKEAYERRYKRAYAEGVQRGRKQAIAAAQSAAAAKAAAAPPSTAQTAAGTTSSSACPGAGCAHPPTPAARPEDCPSGEVPVGETGACAPSSGGEGSGSGGGGSGSGGGGSGCQRNAPGFPSDYCASKSEINQENAAEADAEGDGGQ